MKFQWLNKNNNKKLIVFFNGWGFDENVVSNLEYENFDILMFYDYQNFDDIQFDFSIYEEKYLIAWSLGVYVCNFYFNQLKNFNGFTAINGTQNPIDDNWGIPVCAYNMTINNFSELTCKKFIKKINAPFVISKTTEELKNELISIQNLKCKKLLTFNKAIISKNDKIFPYKNMVSFWSSRSVKIEEIEASHYIFDKYKSWSDFL